MKTPVIDGIELKTVEDVEKALIEHAGGEDEASGAGMFDDLCPAIVGFSHDNRVVYDYEKILEVFRERDGMTEEEAIDFVEFNTLRSLPYMSRQPVILYPLDCYKEDTTHEGD